MIFHESLPSVPIYGWRYTFSHFSASSLMFYPLKPPFRQDFPMNFPYFHICVHIFLSCSHSFRYLPIFPYVPVISPMFRCFSQGGAPPSYKWLIIPLTSSIYHQQKPACEIRLFCTHQPTSRDLADWTTTLQPPAAPCSPRAPSFWPHSSPPWPPRLSPCPTRLWPQSSPESLRVGRIHEDPTSP